MKAAVLLSISALALASPTQQTYKIPFARRNAVVTNEDGTVNGPAFLRSVANTLRKYNKDYELPEMLQTRGDNLEERASVPLTDQSQSGEDELYYGTGYVGAAKQAFTFDFDTGSSDTFVPGPKCGKSQGCAGTTKYNQKGKDRGNTTTITYGSGQVEGENYLDTLSVAGITANNQNIISLSTASGFSTSAADGLIGMAFPSIAASKSPSFPFTLIQQKKLSSNSFSFYLGRAASKTANNSELTLGGTDKSRYTGAFTKVPVTSQTYWQVLVSGAKVGSAAVAATSAQAAVDTGTTVVIAPTVIAANIYRQIPGAILVPLIGGVSETFYAYPCNSNPQVSFTLGGKSFVINSLDFNLGQLTSGSGLPIVGPLLDVLFGGGSDASGGYCLGGVVGADINPTTPLYILGDTFLKNWYSNYQYVNSKTAYVNLAKAK